MSKLKSVNVLDFIIFFLIFIFCFASFQQPDIIHTAGSSFTYLNGHIKDFYDANKKVMGFTNYLPTTYIFYALWNIPLKILGISGRTSYEFGYDLYWYKTLTLLFFICSSIVLYKIGIKTGLERVNSRLLVILWITTPIAFYSQFIFSQYDIFTVFFVLLGFYFFLEKKLFLFTLCFAISLTLKYYCLFLYIPLLLLYVKEIKKIILHCIVLAIPFLTEVGFYYKSDAFKQGVFGFGANERIYSSGFAIGEGMTFSIFVVLWILIAAFSYYKELDTEEELHTWSEYLLLTVTCVFFMFVFWHPQWLLLVTPFIVLTSLKHNKVDFFLLIDIIMMIGFVAYIVNVWPGNVDQNVWRLGIFNPGNIEMTEMRDLFLLKKPNVFFSVVMACLLINIIFKYPRKRIVSNQYISDKLSEKWNIVRIRFLLGIAMFIVPASISLLYNHGTKLYDLKTEQSGVTQPVGEIIKDNIVGQVFLADADSLNRIEIQFATFNRENTSRLSFNLSEWNNEMYGDTLYTKEISASEIKDNEYYVLNLPDVKITTGKEYIFYVKSLDANTGNGITIWRTSSNQNPNNVYAIINNQKQNYNLHMKIFGRK